MHCSGGDRLARKLKYVLRYGASRQFWLDPQWHIQRRYWIISKATYQDNCICNDNAARTIDGLRVYRRCLSAPVKELNRFQLLLICSARARQVTCTNSHAPSNKAQSFMAASKSRIVLCFLLDRSR